MQADALPVQARPGDGQVTQHPRTVLCGPSFFRGRYLTVNLTLTVFLSAPLNTVILPPALGIRLVFLVPAVFGNASMWMAMFADMGASLLVVGNGLRLLKKGVRPS